MACELLICESNTILEAFFVREDYQGEESIPEIDSSEHPLSENNEETVNAKEPEEENEEPKKKKS